MADSEEEQDSEEFPEHRAPASSIKSSRMRTRREMWESLEIGGNILPDENISSVEPMEVVRDLVSASQPMVSVGFQIARQSSNFGFGIATTVLGGLANVADEIIPQSGTVLRGAKLAVEGSQLITQASLNFAEGITQTCLITSDVVFEEFEIQHGGLFKLCGFKKETSKALVECIKVIHHHIGDVWAMGPLMVMEKLTILAALQSKFEPESLGPAIKDNLLKAQYTNAGQNKASNMREFMGYAIGIYGPLMLISSVSIRTILYD